MNTLVTSNTIEPPEAPQGREHGPEAWKDFTWPALNRLKASLPPTAGGERLSSDVTGCSTTDDCTYETYETYETDETDEIEEAEEAEEGQEAEGLEEKEEVATLGPELSMRIDEAISECRVSDNWDINRPLFMLAHKVRSIEEELNVRFSVDVIAETLHRWQGENHDHLENDHDYLAEFLDKLSLVRFPRGRALARAVEIARGIVPPRQTMLLSADVQLLASLCSVLQQQAGKKPFFLDGRSAAKALGKPHRTVASWLRALNLLVVIKRISKGSRGRASRYLYVGDGLNTGGKHTNTHLLLTLTP